MTTNEREQRSRGSSNESSKECSSWHCIDTRCFLCHCRRCFDSSGALWDSVGRARNVYAAMPNNKHAQNFVPRPQLQLPVYGPAGTHIPDPSAGGLGLVAAFAPPAAVARSSSSSNSSAAASMVRYLSKIYN